MAGPAGNIPLRELPPNSTRPRFVSHTATPRSRNDSLLQLRRKRAITLSPDASTPRGLGPDSSNPVIVEMRKRGLTDFTQLLNQLSELNSPIQDVCNQCADHVAKSKQLPRRPSPPSQPSPLGKPAHEFSSTEDYVFFALLSIVNTAICDFVFRPFHPAASEKENARWMEEYIEVIDTSLQAQSAKWRSENFAAIDNQVNRNKFAVLIQRFTDAVVAELNHALEPLAGQTSFPPSFAQGLESIYRTAYDWNRAAKKDVLKYDFEPYIVEPLAEWDPERMESFERLETAVRPDTKVISCVSMGLVGSISLGGARVSHVQRKAQVLVEEWFPKTTQPRPARAMDPTSPPARGNSNQDTREEPKRGCCC